MKVGQMEFSFEGQIALVTGSAQGLGREIALALAQHGASLVLADKVFPTDTAKEIQESGGSALALKTDISLEVDVQELVRQAMDHYQRIDILVNNAGVSQLSFSPSEDTALLEWKTIIDINLTGTFLCCQKVGKQMISQGGGSIINIASTAGFNGIPRAAAYCASKAGVILLTKSLAVEWAGKNVRVNAIAPHYIETDLTRTLRDSPKVYEGIVRQIPMKRFAKSEEIIGTLLLLASPASSYLTGSIIAVDGGFLAQ
jgi:NAD(P)-dependent dehydrogenase (short-subunit alcohol dehydrogenase family)